MWQVRQGRMIVPVPRDATPLEAAGSAAEVGGNDGRTDGWGGGPTREDEGPDLFPLMLGGRVHGPIDERLRFRILFR